MSTLNVLLDKLAEEAPESHGRVRQALARGTCADCAHVEIQDWSARLRDSAIVWCPLKVTWLPRFVSCTKWTPKP